MSILDEGFVTDLSIKHLYMVMQMNVEQQICFKVPKIVQTRSIVAAAIVGNNYFNEKKSRSFSKNN